MKFYTSSELSGYAHLKLNESKTLTRKNNPFNVALVSFKERFIISFLNVSIINNHFPNI